MSIAKELASISKDRFIIPCAGKMFYSTVNNKDKALCLVVNKGYFETVTLDGMLDILDKCSDIDSIVFVGEVEKIKLSETSDIVYRQRIFFKSLSELLDLCKLKAIQFNLADDFQVSINNLVNCKDALDFLEIYAMQHNESISTWLTNVCKFHIVAVLQTKDMFYLSQLDEEMEEIIKGKYGYLDRAPFLVSSYNISNKTSSIFLETDIHDDRLYSFSIKDRDVLDYGYTSRNIANDIKAGVFKRECTK